MHLVYRHFWFVCKAEIQRDYNEITKKIWNINLIQSQHYNLVIKFSLFRILIYGVFEKKSALK